MSVGGLSGQTGARAAANAVTDAWNSAQFAFRVTAASEPVEGGSPGAGALGFLTFASGRREYFTALLIKTDHDLPTMSWATLLSEHRAVSLGLLGLDSSVELDHAELA